MTKPIPLSRAATQLVAVLGVCLLAFACPAAAFKPATKGPGGENTPLNLAPVSSGSHPSASGGASVIRTIEGTVLVAGLIWGMGWFMRRSKTKTDRGHLKAPTGGLQSVAALPLGTGRSVHLVRVGEDYVLLGSAEHGVVPIQRYTAEQAQAIGLLSLDQPVARPRRSLFSAADAVTPGEARQPDPMRMPSPASSLVERLRELTVRR